MKIPTNRFKQALLTGERQIGLWCALADAYACEILASVGFDWLLLDAEHAPNDLRTLLAQLQAVAPYSTHPVIRCADGSSTAIKHYLDIGAQTLLIPNVESAEMAQRIVASARYAPQGFRGVGSALARASLWNQIEDYLPKANAEVCILVQVESVAALRQVDSIAGVEGVDGVFFGPADLSASMGFLGKPGASEVQAALLGGIDSVLKSGKAAGILTSDKALAQTYLDRGAKFVAVGADTTLLQRAAHGLLAHFNQVEVKASSGVY